MATSVVKNFDDGVYKIADSGGVGGMNVITHKMGTGGLGFTVNTPNLVKKDRGALDHARAGEEEPLDWTLESEFRGFYGATGTANSGTTLYEGMYALSSASDWDTDEPNSNTKAFIQELTKTDPGDASTETVTIVRSFTNTFEYSEGTEEDTISAAGQAMVVHPTIT